jgi:hypothetical protein
MRASIASERAASTVTDWENSIFGPDDKPGYGSLSIALSLVFNAINEIVAANQAGAGRPRCVALAPGSMRDSCDRHSQ